jgi:hypothetical protein
MNHGVSVETVFSVILSLGIDPRAFEYKAVTLGTDVVCRKYLGVVCETQGVLRRAWEGGFAVNRGES